MLKQKNNFYDIKKNRITVLITGNIILFIGSFLAIELVLRIFGIGYGHCPIIADPILHHVNPKNYIFLSHTPSEEFGGFYVYYNSEGLISNPNSRNLKCDYVNKDLLVFFGDSFVAALQVPYAQSFIGLLEKRLEENTCIKNYGVDSYSPLLYYLQWKYYVSKIKPHKVFMLLSANDIDNDRFYISQAKFSTTGDLIAVDGGHADKLTILLRKSYLARLLRRAYLKVKYAIENRHIHNKKRIGQFIEENPEISELTSTYILKIAEEVKKSGGEFILMAVPSKYNHFNRITNDLGEFSKKCEIWAKNNSIEFIDLVGPFHKAYQDIGKKLFLNKDIHFNKYSHQTIANVTEKYLNKD